MNKNVLNLSLILVFVLGCAACSKLFDFPPTIEIFSGSSSYETPGQYTFRYSVYGAASISIDQGIGSIPCNGEHKWSYGAYFFYPTETKTYILTAKNSSGTSTAQTTVTVN